MARPLVVVQGLNEQDSQSLIAQWSAAIPALDFESAVDSRALLKSLSARRATAVVIRSGSESAVADIAAEVRRKYPGIALLILHCDAPDCSRPEAELCASEQQRSLSFLREDVLRAARGSLTGVALPSVLQVLQFEQRTCTLRVRWGRKSGRLVVRNGQLFHAEFSSHAPRDAALEMLGWASADVLFEPAPAMTTPTIDAPLDFLLLEAARVADERSHGGALLESIRPGPASSIADWRLPNALRDGGVALVEAVVRIPGARSAALVDVTGRRLLAHRAETAGEPGCANQVSAIVQAVYEMLAESDSRDWMDEVILNLSTRFAVIRALRGEAHLVICAEFDHRAITVGFAKMSLAQVMEEHCAVPATSGV
ncbi:MAG: DUF4388 domain-containing protein [Polyangiales bacterium]